MTVNASRLGAAFFVSVVIILALALSVLYLAMPVKVQAQTMMRTSVMECTSPHCKQPLAILPDAYATSIA